MFGFWSLGLRCFRRAHRNLLEYFMPPGLDGDDEAANRARVFLISHFFGPFLGNTAPLALYLADPTPGIDIAILSASVFGFWVFPFLLRAGVAYGHLAVLSILNLNFAIYLGAYQYGGVASPTLVWILIIPVLSIFYIGGEHRLKWALLSTTGGCFVLFFLAYNWLPHGENDLPPFANVMIGATSVVGTLIYVASMAIYYGSIFDSSVRLESEVKRRRQLATELREAVVAANRASTAKSEFLARMSHELRTPLNAIIGYGQLLREEAEDDDDDFLLQDVSRILDAGRYLVRLIDMILDLSKMEAGRMTFDLRPADPSEVIYEVAAARREQVESRGNRLVLSLDDAPEEAVIDRGRFKQVVDSVLENAAQYTCDGIITVTVHGATHRGAAAIAIDVSDTGAGIAPEHLPSVFESFSTSREAADGRYGGTGLNLTVTSRLCRAMGGDIAVRSTLGEGSVFTITLPGHVRAGAVPGAAIAPAPIAA